MNGQKTWNMDTIIRVDSVGVLGVSTKIATFVIQIELDGGKVKVGNQMLDFHSTLRTSYKEFDESLGVKTDKSFISDLENMVGLDEIMTLVDEYIETVQVTDADKNSTRQLRSLFGFSYPTLGKEALKENLINEVKLAYKNYIDRTLYEEEV